MELDDLKTVWAAHGARLERSLAIDERLLREVLRRKVRFALAPYVLWRALEVVLGFAVLLLGIPVLAAHATELRYLVAGGAFALCAVGFTAFSAYLLVNGLRFDFGGPVTAIQRDVERVRMVEYRAVVWAVLGGVLVWLPAALVLFEALTGVAALAHVDLAYLVANLLFGLVVLVIGYRLSKRYVDRKDLGPRARRFLDAVTGRGLRAAASHLAELASFVREESVRA